MSVNRGRAVLFLLLHLPHRLPDGARLFLNFRSQRDKRTYLFGRTRAHHRLRRALDILSFCRRRRRPLRGIRPRRRVFWSSGHVRVSCFVHVVRVSFWRASVSKTARRRRRLHIRRPSPRPFIFHSSLDIVSETPIASRTAFPRRDRRFRDARCDAHQLRLRANFFVSLHHTYRY